MSPPVDPVTSSETLPKETEVVVIGGGVAGVATAYFLAKQGVPVTVCEKGRIAGEQSSRNWGYCRQQGRDPREAPLIKESLRIWRGLDAEISSALGGSNEASTGFRQAGVMYLAGDEEEMIKHEVWAGIAKEHGIDTKLLGKEALKELLPETAAGHKDWLGALHTASDGRAEPAQAVPALARAAQALGATILTDCAVRGVETEAGSVARVVTERGSIKTKKVVVAGGAWSRLILKRLGVDLPQQTVISSVLRTAPLEAQCDISVAGPGFAWRKRLDGGYNLAHASGNIYPITPDTFRLMRAFWPAFKKDRKAIRPRFGSRFFEALGQERLRPLDATSAFEETRVWDPEPSKALLAEALRNVSAAYPIFEKAEVKQTWAGGIDVTPDAVPVISPVTEVPGLVIATGFSGHGFGIGPGAGRLTADLIMGSAPVVDPTPYALDRFKSGPVGPFLELQAAAQAGMA